MTAKYINPANVTVSNDRYMVTGISRPAMNYVECDLFCPRCGDTSTIPLLHDSEGNVDEPFPNCEHCGVALEPDPDSPDTWGPGIDLPPPDDYDGDD